MIRSFSACFVVALSCSLVAVPAHAADKPLSLKTAKSAATKHANAKGRARYPFDTFSVSVKACKRDARFKVSCQAALRGVAACLATQCAPLGPGLYREECTWKSVVTAHGPGHRQTRVNAYAFKCKLGEALPDA